MCGITGSVLTSGVADREVLGRQVESLAHRGPDDSGIWVGETGRVALGSCRLAVQDLTTAGHMPMSDPTGKVWVVYNGEIYNFRQIRRDLKTMGHSFRSGTDTEVLLAAYLEWDTDCLQSLNGMFAFAIYDERDARRGNGRVFLARDRAGQKPLYYWHCAGGLSFASELKALLEDPRIPRRINIEGLMAYLTYGYVAGSQSMISGVYKLPPAHAMIYDVTLADLRIWRYWTLPKPCANDNQADAESLTDELESRLQESVRRHLVADVPVGILLSGGVDSSLVTAMAARVSDLPVKTFTISFPGYGKYDEAPHARKVARHFDTQHHELVAESTTIDLLPRLAAQFDEPLADSSLVPTFLVSQLTREHVTVALGGDGGDELFGGYGHYRSMLRTQRARYWIPSSIRDAVASSASNLPIGLKGRNFLLGLRGDACDQAIAASLFDDRARTEVLSQELLHSFNGRTPCSIVYSRMRANWPDEGDLVDRMTRFDFQTYLADDILTKVDRASMAVSLELRAPLLDQHIIEFAFGKVPSTLKVNGRNQKILLRRLAECVLPPDLDIQRKQGFSVPLQRWFQGPWGTYCSEVLEQCDPAIFDRDSVHDLIDGQKRGFSNTSRIFGLTMFELWRRHYNVEL